VLKWLYFGVWCLRLGVGLFFLWLAAVILPGNYPHNPEAAGGRV